MCRNVSWFYPKYWPTLVRWADEVVNTSEFPAEQLCTDDFTGKLANNTNLGVRVCVCVACTPLAFAHDSQSS